jgi:hypothetical protein
MNVSPRRQDGGQNDAIGRYLDYMRVYAEALTRKAEREARQNAVTGEHQELDALFHVRDDSEDTRTRLEQYARRLRLARSVGRYVGGTTLRRLLPDGTTEPWMPPGGSRLR